MRKWADDFYNKFPQELGRLVYVGGDDLVGLIYSSHTGKKVEPFKALQWLMELPAKWKQYGQPINLSVGFVWAGANFP
ncbi:MAG: hypothetical protein HC836_12995 [Richelia sp. RM2_1_2]|nr:hypothetical protein [Richelia sp. SM1_7_0]NJN11972.1 hypothetical protein [Richelia sp. RM1_1_1]NJO59204.1 hypothetical protein [Richelia sp. RM2_1_2]